MPDNVVIVGAGMITAVGLSAAETAASVRSGTARFAESSILDKRFEPFVLAEVPDEGLPELTEEVAKVSLTAREARMMRLATVALAGCLKSLPEGEPPPGLSLALPETETTRPLEHEEVLKHLLEQAGGRVGASRGGAATGAGLAPWGTVSVVAQTMEPGHLYSEEPYRGDGLAQAVQQLAQLGGFGGPIQEVYSSMNGENHWAKEWGVVRIRANGTFSAEQGMHHPADCYGDTGAACGPLMTGLAALGLREGYRGAPALVYASSDHGGRAALWVR